jgi:hypothetical protein
MEQQAPEMKALALYHDGTLSLSRVHFFCAIGKAAR